MARIADPMILAVDNDPVDLEVVSRELRGRYTVDYEEVCVGSAEDPGEELLGVAAVNWQRSVFKQTACALGVTGGKLILQPLDRKGRASNRESPTFIRRDEIRKGSYGGGGGIGSSSTAMIMDSGAEALIAFLDAGSAI